MDYEEQNGVSLVLQRPGSRRQLEDQLSAPSGLLSRVPTQ